MRTALCMPLEGARAAGRLQARQTACGARRPCKIHPMLCGAKGADFGGRLYLRQKPAILPGAVLGTTDGELLETRLNGAVERAYTGNIKI